MASSSLPDWNKIGAWTRGERLGSGGFGRVYIGHRNSDGKIFSVKSVFFVPESEDNNIDSEKKIIEEYELAGLVNEIRTLKKLRSPYVVRYIGCGTSEFDDCLEGPDRTRLLLDLYLEYYPHGCLRTAMAKRRERKGLSEPVVRVYTRDILHGLKYLHSNSLVHGDLKLDNILIGNDVCKILDFGSAKDVRTSSIWKVLIGTPDYAAPEQESEKETTYKSDIFSLGCCVLEMATGKAPVNYADEDLPDYSGSEGSASYGSALSDFGNRKIPDFLSRELQSFLSKCLHTEPAKRWSANRLLGHRFITKKERHDFNPYPRYKDKNGKLMKTHENIISPPEMSRTTLEKQSFMSMCRPLSPIPTIPTKRRRDEFEEACCQSISVSDVIRPGRPLQDGEEKTAPLWYGPQSNEAVSDEDSSTAVEKYPCDRDGKYARPSSREKRKRVRRATVSTRPHPLEAKKTPRQKNAAHSKRGAGPQGQTSQHLLPSSSSRSDASSKGSARYPRGRPEDLPPELDRGVAKLTVEEGEEPLVVQICREFEIPIPRESLYMIPENHHAS